MTSIAVGNLPMPPDPWTGVTGDSRRVQPGYAFVAIPGTRVDGHRFVTDALRRGASCIYSERPLPRPFPVPTFQVGDARSALAVLTSRFYGDPAHHIRCIGTTGTNGKTTTTTMLQWLLNTPRRRAGLMGTVHIDTGDRVEHATLTTPDAETLHSGLAQMVKNRLEVAVLEVSSHGIKQQRVYGIPFSLAIFTNLSPDHSDFHPTLDDYATTKASLFASVPASGAVVVNGDDHQSQLMLRDAVARHFTYGVHDPSADLHAERVRHTREGMRITLRLSDRLIQAAAEAGSMPQGRFELFTPLFGKHNVSNALAAVAGALVEGMPMSDIIKGMASFPGVWRRQQRLAVKGPVVIDDCCHNPDSYLAMFEALRHQPSERLFFVNAIRGSRGVQINRAIAGTLADWASNHRSLELWITDCTDTAGHYDTVTEGERTAFLQELNHRNVRYSHHPELRPILEHITRSAEPRDMIVLAGAHAMDPAAQIFLELWEKRAVS